MADKPSLEAMFRGIREARMPPIVWPLPDDRDPLDFVPRALTDDEKVARYLEVCRGLGIKEESLPAAERWFRENRL